MDYKKIFKNREFRLKIICMLRFIPNKLYLKMVYKILHKGKLNFKNPETFCDKMNWLKVNMKNSSFTDLVDKIKVRDIVKNKIGEEHLIKTYGQWDKFEKIDFENLPEKFILKCNHDSGSTKVIEKSKMNYKKLKKFYNNRLKINPYFLAREYPYKNVKPFIVAEKFMIDDVYNDLRDYKFFVFNGEPKFLFVASERKGDDVFFDFFDMNFNSLDFTWEHPKSTKEIEKPKEFEEMVELVKKLAIDCPFVRIDMYIINGKIYFGEYTFFHGGGMHPFEPYEYEKKIGEMIKL